MKATPTPTTPETGSAIERLRALAAEAVKTGSVVEPEPHPDAELLDLCATILDGHAEAHAIDREARRNFVNNVADPDFAAALRRCDAVKDGLRKPLLRIGKIPAKTAAGIYAKALVFRVVHYGGGLITSMVDDLITCPGLRASLWPAERT